ncbi:MAG: UDP-N-acetylmuramoylalanyl-D-glutamate--L-ornithine ligase [uncultured Thermomicrobiales bacterium]|uniref:UDP-N-acetylmuramyl-tripeptide synthetase n=1 Tax=uncultured Thermomicrobiales bacterium TaxID=1645740 RepID=A0A6J4TKU5_9BACT|nr:MAG: UDP-N-acetylmuramoylalanyl-D-glutamate--L-ornithine ligase [uncultured Thermomicrobiales bacterium]
MDRSVRLSALASELGIQIARADDVVIGGVVYDSRAVEPGFLFAALVGGDADGHDYAAEAVSRGAAAVLAERPLPIPAPVLIVPDSRAALAPLAAAFYGHPSRGLGVIGITGTDGKTTTSYLVDSILRRAGRRTGMVGTVSLRVGDEVLTHGTRQTTPESADIQRYLRRMADAGVDWAVLEATSHGLDLHRLDGVRFGVGAVTNITHEHLEHHKTIAAYRRAKAILFERVGAVGGVAVINADDPGAAEMVPYAKGATIVRFGMDREAEVTASDVRLSATGSRFRLDAFGERVAIRLPYIGGFNVANALCAAGVALAAGMELAQIGEGLAQAPPVPGRMARVDEGQPFSVVIDYAHTPESLRKVLGLLRTLTPGGRLILVMGSAGERDVEKRAVQGAAATELADFSVFTSEDPRFEDPEAIVAEIAAGAVAVGGKEGTTFARLVDREQAVERAIAMAKPGDCVLLAGKGHEGSIIWGREKRPWDEDAAARRALAARGYHGGPPPNVPSNDISP